MIKIDWHDILMKNTERSSRYLFNGKNPISPVAGIRHKVILSVGYVISIKEFFRAKITV